MNKKSDTFIQFIDPEELIEFIPDSDLGSVEMQSGDESVEVLGTSDPMRITESIKVDAESYAIVKKEDTRGRLAIIYTVATLLIFVFVILLSFIESIINKTSLVANLTQIIPLISGVLFGTLGFVLGYYFRNDTNEGNTDKNR